MDRGIATEENLVWLRAQGYRYLVVSRERQRQFDADAAIAIQTAGGDPVAVQRVLDAEGGEVRLYCCSERRAHKEEGIAERFCTRFEAALQALHEGLARPRTTKRIAKLLERIGRLKEKSHGVGQHYTITIEPDAGGVNAQAIRWERRPVDGTLLTHPGVYCLRTNEPTWDSEQLWRIDVMLTDLEAVFRSLKSELGLRPVYHQTAERAEGHLFITVLAYQFVQIIRRRLRAHGITRGCGPACARSSPANAGSPPPSAVPTGAPCMCARPPNPNRRSWRSSGHWAATPPREVCIK
ncbi:transposase [Thiocapsa sp.]|uniref:IS1634 family transposase n=1 Tax=Thiocapsa sp. TaxID=2024551 RepID=UPI002633FEBB|nr:transposase [Thiocapsa sp.]